ncbi:MAG: peptidase C39 family protein [Candidatus Micrarchaeota archaeon]|nr:peptidase C39 family protein [Candidatus Micrarchaeota archaeon]
MEANAKECHLSVPFYPNVTADGNRCFQVSMQSVLKYFLGKEFDAEYLDKITGRKLGFNTYTFQIVPFLHEAGLKVRYFSSVDPEPFLEGEPFIRRHYGKDAEVYLKLTDMDAMMSAVKKILKTKLFEKRILSLPELEAHLLQGHVPMVLLDWHKITGHHGPYQGHFVVMTGFDAKNIYFHDSGPDSPTPNYKVDKKLFVEAWNANGTDNDVVIVYGKS